MSEPTIDEMVAWLESHDDGLNMVDAIRAILEQQRMLVAFNQGAAFGQLQIIRAFVERVDKAFDEAKDTVPEDYAAFVDQELQAMEQEAQQ